MVNVFPSSPDPSHDISLSDSVNTYGFTFAGGPRVLQEIPLSPPAQAFEVQGKTFIGGRGVIRNTDDATGFFDSQNLWTTSEGKMHPSPLWLYAGLRSDVVETREEGNTLSWVSIYGATRYYSDNLVPAATFTADKVYIHLRRFGTPGTLTLEVCANNAGEPGTVLKTVTMAESVVPDTVSVYKVFDFTGTQSLADTDVYHIKVYGASTDDVSNHWEILSYSGDGKTSANNSTWSASAYGLFFRVTGADSTPGRWYFFTLESQMYAVFKYDAGSNSALKMNGFRGIAASATSTTLTCSQTATRNYAGAYIRIIDGTGDGQVRQITSNTTGASIVFTVPTWDITPDSTSKFVVYGTPYWDNVTGSYTLGPVVGQPVVTNDIAYFPEGTVTTIRRMRVNGNSHDVAAETTMTGDILYVNTDASTGTQIWSANSAAATVSNANVAAWGTALVALTTTTIGTSSFRITNMYNYSGSFYIFKEDGLYKFDGTRVTRVGKNFSDIPDINNGGAVADDNTYLWFTWGHSAERMLGSNITDMLNWRAGYDGLPDNRRGIIREIVSAVGWMFFVVDGGASNYSSVIMWNGFGWHELFRGHEVGVRIRGAAWQQCPETNPILWVDINGEMIYFEFPKNGSVPVRDTALSYVHEGVFITPTIDAGSIETYKIIKSIKIFQDAILLAGVDAQPVRVDYQINQNVDTTSWTYLGEADASPFEELLLNLGGVTRIRFRFRILSDAYRTPGVVTGYSVSGREMPLAKYQYVGSYVASTDMDTRQGEPDVSSNTTYAWLQACAIAQTKLTLRTLQASSDSKIVTVSLPVKVADWVDEENWGGRISFAILET